MPTVEITLEDETRVTQPVGMPVGSLLPKSGPTPGLPFLGAMVNHDVVSLSYPLAVDSRIRFLTMADPYGWRIYRNSLCFLVAKAVRDLYPDAAFRLEHSFGLGLYCSFSPGSDAQAGIGSAQLEALQRHTRELVERDLPIERRKTSYSDAVARLRRAGQTEKLNLLWHRNPPRVVLHWCDGFYDLAHGPLAPATGSLDRFELIPYRPGFVIHLPAREDPLTLAPFEDQPHLFRIIQEHKEWGKILGITTAGQLNELVAAGRSVDLIRTIEALHEKKVASIADQIAAARDRIKVILIAGPSSAGKTTFAKRLSTQLRVNGLRPVTVGTDDYFVGEEDNPRDERGRPDYEHIEAVDLDLFNRNLAELVEGRQVELPSFNFTLKCREFTGRRLRLGHDQILIIEGIHGLNPRLTRRVPAQRKFRIYVNALAQLSVDSNNRISMTDNRLMRRIIRDHQFRGHPALETLRLWPSVRRGEKLWIFPFQKEADATFNSALDYELAVLKPIVEPLLMQVKPSDPEYAEARRLTEFLLNFLGLPPDRVPDTSILREYIGGSGYDY